jgi:hypothetical protein
MSHHTWTFIYTAVSNSSLTLLRFFKQEIADLPGRHCLKNLMGKMVTVGNVERIICKWISTIRSWRLSTGRHCGDQKRRRYIETRLDDSQQKVSLYKLPKTCRDVSSCSTIHIDREVLLSVCGPYNQTTAHCHSLLSPSDEASTSPLWG